MSDIRRWRWLIAVASLVALLGVACGSDEPTDTGTGADTEVEEFEEGSPMAAIQEKGELTVGVKYDVPPFGFENPQSGEIEGFDVDIAQRLADELGVELNAIEAISDNRIPFLVDGKVDLIASTMTITTDRDVEIDFSDPYYIANGRILVPKDSDVASLEDLANKRVCTALGSTYEGIVTEEIEGVKAKTPETYSECFELIQNGAVDAVVTDDVILTGMIIQDDSLHLVGDDLTVEPYGIGMPEGSDDSGLQEWVNSVLAETYEDGSYESIYDQWVGQYTGDSVEIPEMSLDEALELRPCEELCDQVEE